MRQPLGYLVPKVLTLPTGLVHMVLYTSTHSPTQALYRFLQHYLAFSPYILCACVFICAFLSIVSKLPYADAVYFNVSSDFRVNVSGIVKSGEVVFYANNTLSVDSENFMNIVLTFSSYYSSLFQVR